MRKSGGKILVIFPLLKMIELNYLKSYTHLLILELWGK
jgi:hypothetical protein